MSVHVRGRESRARVHQSCPFAEVWRTRDTEWLLWVMVVFVMWKQCTLLLSATPALEKSIIHTTILQTREWSRHRPFFLQGWGWARERLQFWEPAWDCRWKGLVKSSSFVLQLDFCFLFFFLLREICDDIFFLCTGARMHCTNTNISHFMRKFGSHFPSICLK